MDTTVILAQPRVSRLRAAAGYVDSRGCVGLRGASAEIEEKHSGEFFQGPPDRRIWIGVSGAKSDLSHGQIFRPKSAPVIYPNKPLSGSGPKFSVCFGTQIWPYCTPKNRFFRIFRQNPHFLLHFSDFLSEFSICFATQII